MGTAACGGKGLIGKWHDVNPPPPHIDLCSVCQSVFRSLWVQKAMHWILLGRGGGI